LGFSVAEETQALMRQMVAAGELDHLVPERVWQELAKALGEGHPARFIEVLRQCGALKVILPELDRLFGVPQPEKYHPEIDCGIHSLLVLEQAALLDADPRTRFAALCHDLGKGLTSAEILPAHHGHEERSATLVSALCQRLRVPTEYRDLALLTARYHGHIHKADELRPDTFLRVLEQCDALRRPQRFEQILIACEADSRGRLGFEQAPYPQAERFRRALSAAQGFDPASIDMAGLRGEQIKQRIHQGRLAAIRQALM
ncbi:MAG: HD domain-containing protein, partial [Gammaproteobacteria bacterium SHHR-1]